CACSSSALVGMHPHRRHVPPSAFCFSTTATFRPSCAARMAATYPPVPAPITTTSYSFGISTLERREGDEAGAAGFRCGLGLPGRRLRIELGDPCTQLPVIVPQFPVRLGEALEPLVGAARPGQRGDGHDNCRNGEQPVE